MPAANSREGSEGRKATEKNSTNNANRATPRMQWMSWGRRIALVAAGILLWLMSVVWPFTTGAMGYEESWVQVLHYAFANRWQWGSDLIFTYGPLGFLLTYEYVPETFPYVVAWNILGHGACIGLVVYYASRMKSLIGTALLLILLLLFACFEHAYGRDHFYLVTLWLMCCGHLSSRSTAWWPLVAIFGIGTVLSLAKFTYFPVYLGIVATLLIHLWREAGWKRAGMALIAAVGLGVAAWIACGQSLSSLPRHIRSSLEISRGYSFAMMGPFGNREELILAGVIAVAFVLCGVLRFRDEGSALSRWLTAAVTGMVMFLVWKHGFVRHDGHCFIYFSVLPCLACGAWLDSTPSRIAAKGKTVLALVVIVVGLFGAFRRADIDKIQPSPTSFTEIAGIAAGRSEKSLRMLSHLSAYASEQAELRRAVNRLDGNSQLQAKVGQEPVAWLMNTQSQPLITGLRLYPRGVIQSYSAYTEWLANEDAKCFRSASGPRYVAVRMDLADGRVPLGDDGPAILEILSRYRPVGNFGGAILFERLADANVATAADDVFVDREIEIGQSLALEESANSWTAISLDVRHSTWGRLITGLYKSPQVRLHIETTDGMLYDYQLIPDMCRAWFLIDPLVTGGGDFARLAADSLDRRTKRLRIHIANDDRDCFSNRIRVRLRRQARLPRLAGSELDALLYPALYTQPVELSAPSSGTGLLHGKSIFFLGAPGRARLPLPSQARRLRGTFGQMEIAASADLKQTGVVLALSHIDEKGTRVSLFQKSLNPWTNPADRGEHQFDVTLPGLSGGWLQLESNTDSQWSDGSYWRDVRWE